MNKLRTQKAVYTHVRKHLLTQKRKAVDEEGESVHRGPTCMCSIGSMIPDKWCNFADACDQYVPFETVEAPAEYSRLFYKSYEWTGTASGTMAGVAKYHGLPSSERTSSLLHDLERVHEDFSVKDWEDALDHIGYAYGFKGV